MKRAKCTMGCSRCHEMVSQPEKIISWTKSYYDALHPYSAGGAYVNFLMGDEGDDRVKKTYGDNYERLVAIKNRYDPGNLFRVNQNIKPS
jgi:FAD/FMN-containing dehydrogenase